MSLRYEAPTLPKHLLGAGRGPIVKSRRFCLGIGRFSIGERKGDIRFTEEGKNQLLTIKTVNFFS